MRKADILADDEAPLRYESDDAIQEEKSSGRCTQKLHLAYRNTLIESLEDRHELGPLRPYQVLRGDG
jgi:hypothetical protein